MPQKKATHPHQKTKEKQSEQRFTLTFDEFFKIGMKAFFTEFGYDVQSEVELFKLPKKLDVLLIKQGKENSKEAPPKEFELLDYFKKYNLESYKSPRDRIREKDIRDAVIYLNGYINITKEANYNNTTMSIFCNHKPEKFLKKNRANIVLQSSGYWQINYGLFTVHLLNLNQTELNGLESLFLKDFADVAALRVAYEKLQQKRIGNIANVKIVDMIRQFIYYRAYGLDTSLLKEFEMPNVAEIDITDIVKPHYERGVEQGLERGRQEAYQKAIEAARKMLDRGYDIDEICELTSLTREQVEKLSGEK